MSYYWTRLTLPFNERVIWYFVCVLMCHIDLHMCTSTHPSPYRHFTCPNFTIYPYHHFLNKDSKKLTFTGPNFTHFPYFISFSIKRPKKFSFIIEISKCPRSKVSYKLIWCWMFIYKSLLIKLAVSISEIIM